MKLEDFKDVEKTINQRNSIIRAMEECEQSLGGTDHGGWCYLSKHSDGSGKLVNMAGCETTYEVLEAVEEVLFRKLLEVNNTLETLGVEIPKEDFKCHAKAILPCM